MIRPITALWAAAPPSAVAAEHRASRLSLSRPLGCRKTRDCLIDSGAQSVAARVRTRARMRRCRGSICTPTFPFCDRDSICPFLPIFLLLCLVSAGWGEKAGLFHAQSSTTGRRLRKSATLRSAHFTNNGATTKSALLLAVRRNVSLAQRSVPQEREIFTVLGLPSYHAPSFFKK